MAKENTEYNHPFDNPFTQSFYSMDYMRNLMNWGIKAQQTWMDQSIRTTQVMSQFLIDQAGETAKMGQQFFKQTMSVNEDLAKSFTQATTPKN